MSLQELQRVDEFLKRGQYGKLLQECNQLLELGPPPPLESEREFRDPKASSRGTNAGVALSDSADVADLEDLSGWGSFTGSDVGSSDHPTRTSKTTPSLTPALPAATYLTPSQRVDLLLTRSKALQETGRLYEAERDCVQAIDMDPTRPEGYIQRARVQTSLGQWEKAFETCTLALMRDCDSVEALLFRSTCALRLKHFNQCLQDCSNVLGFEPEHTEAHLMRARVFAELRKYEDVIRECNTILSIDPSHSGGFKERANALNKLGRHAEGFTDALASLGGESYDFNTFAMRSSSIWTEGGMEEEIGARVAPPYTPKQGPGKEGAGGAGEEEEDGSIMSISDADLGEESTEKRPEGLDFSLVRAVAGDSNFSPAASRRIVKGEVKDRRGKEMEDDGEYSPPPLIKREVSLPVHKKVSSTNVCEFDFQFSPTGRTSAAFADLALIARGQCPLAHTRPLLEDGSGSVARPGEMVPQVCALTAEDLEASMASGACTALDALSYIVEGKELPTELTSPGAPKRKRSTSLRSNRSVRSSAKVVMKEGEALIAGGGGGVPLTPGRRRSMSIITGMEQSGSGNSVAPTGGRQRAVSSLSGILGSPSTDPQKMSMSQGDSSGLSAIQATPQTVDISSKRTRNERISHLQSIWNATLEAADGFCCKGVEVTAEELPELLEYLPNICELDVTGNKIDDFSELPDYVPKIQDLNVSGNIAESLPSSWEELASLRKLNASDNLIRDFPLVTLVCKQLEELNLSGNQIMRIPELGSLGLLREANFSRNNIVSCSATVFRGLSNLRRLEFSQSRLSVLPYIGGLRLLVELDISGNSLHLLPDFDEHPNLKIIKANDNEITSVGPTFTAKNFKGLRELDLSGNQIEALPEGMSAFTSLEKINVSGNPLSELFEGLECLTGLEELLLANCSLTAMPPGISDLESLTRLDLSNNKVETLPASLAPLAKQLEKCRLEGNPWDRIDADTHETLEKWQKTIVSRNGDWGV